MASHAVLIKYTCGLLQKMLLFAHNFASLDGGYLVKRAFWILNVVLLLLSAALGSAGYFVLNEYLRALLVNAATTFLGLTVALLIVNYYLAATERKDAAAPLAKLIQGAMIELHDELFVEHWNNTFGTHKAKELLKKYHDNKRAPRTFSPQECDEIHAALMAKSAELQRNFDILIDQFRELSMITGWSFDPEITAAALEARLNFVKFKSLCSATDTDSKYKMIEAFLDGESAANEVFSKLMEHIGLEV